PRDVEHAAHAGVHQERLVAGDQELVELDAEAAVEGRDAVHAARDLGDGAVHDAPPFAATVTRRAAETTPARRRSSIAPAASVRRRCLIGPRRCRKGAAMSTVTRSEQGWLLHHPPAALERRWLGSGLWLDTTLGAFVDERLRANAALELRIWSKTHPYRGTIGEVRELARRFAGGLRACRVEPDDVVAFQPPNWVETAAVFWGTSMLGAVLVPLVHFYGPKEVRYILRHTRAKVLVTAARFRQSDYLAALRSFREELPDLETVVLVG